MTQPGTRPFARSGFTLVELLVAAAITVVLAGILVAVTTSTLGVWNRSRGRVTTSNQVDFVFDQIAADLEGAFQRADGGVWLAATILDTNNAGFTTPKTVLRDDRNWVVSGAQTAKMKPRSLDDPRSFVLDQPAIADCRFGMAGVWLRFFTTKQQSNDSTEGLSAPAAVAYQIVRRNVSGTPGPSNPAEIRYMLFRSEVRTFSSGPSSSTFEAGYDLDPCLPPAASVYVTASGTEGDPGTIIRSPLSHAMACDVVDFGVRFFVREGGGLRLIFPAKPSAEGADADGQPPLGVPSDSGELVPSPELEHLARPSAVPMAGDHYRNRFPEIVEIMVRVLTDEGAQKIRNIEAGKDPDDWWETAEKHSRVFTRLVAIQGRPL